MSETPPETFEWDGDTHTLAGDCDACWAHEPEVCAYCGGRSHTHFGDEWRSEDDEGYWLAHLCQTCGATDNLG